MSEIDINKAIGNDQPVNLDEFRTENQNKDKEQPKQEETTNDNKKSEIDELLEIEEEDNDDEDIEDDIDDLLDDEEETEDDSDDDLTEEKMQKIIKDYKDKFKESIYKPMDLSAFTIEETATVNIKNLFDKSVKESVTHLINKIPYEIELYRGIDVRKIDSIINARNNKSSNQRLIEVIKEFFNHIINKDSELTFEDWAKTVAMMDIADITAAIYKSVINGEDSMAVTCESCNESYIINLNDRFENVYMKFDDEKVKEDYLSLYDNEETLKVVTGKRSTKLVNINKRFAIELKVPSIYDHIIVSEHLSKNFKKQMKDNRIIANFSEYIGRVFEIRDNKLIDLRIDNSSKIKNNGTIKDDADKVRLKIANLTTIFNNLTAKDLDVTEILMNEFIKENETNGKYKYINPGHTCPLCSHENKSEEIDNMVRLVLTRLRFVSDIF